MEGTRGGTVAGEEEEEEEEESLFSWSVVVIISTLTLTDSPTVLTTFTSFASSTTEGLKAAPFSKIRLASDKVMLTFPSSTCLSKPTVWVCSCFRELLHLSSTSCTIRLPPRGSFTFRLVFSYSSL